MRRLAAALGLRRVYILFMAALVVSLAAQTASPAQKLYGMWYTYPLGNPDTDSLRHQFWHNPSTNRDELIVTRLCQGNYRAVIARVVSPIEISAGTIRVLKSASDRQPGELNSVCQVSLDAGVLGYTISEDGNRISITHPGGVPDSFELARQDASSEAALAPSLYGTWLFPLQQQGQDVSVQIKLIFYNTGEGDRGKVRQIAICSQANNSIVSQVDSAVRISKDQITILQSSSHEQRDGPFICKARISAGTLRYSISPNGATMKLSSAKGSPLVLRRDNPAGLN